jgi:hypothetical protein
MWIGREVSASTVREGKEGTLDRFVRERKEGTLDRFVRGEK